MHRLPWRVSWWQIPCKARLDNGTRCDLIRHGPNVAHASAQGEVTQRWQVIAWLDRALDTGGPE